MLTADEKRRINDALTTNGGNRKKAAEALHISTDALKTVIHNNADLRKLWAKPRGITLSTAQSANAQDTGIAIVAESEEAIAARREREFEKLLSGIGDSGELTAALSLQKAYGKFSEECESLIGGSLIERGIKLKRLCDKLDERLAQCGDGGKLDEGFTSISILYVEAHKALSRIMEVVGASRLSRAKIQQIRALNKPKSRGSVGFAPKTTNIMAQNVQVTG